MRPLVRELAVEILEQSAGFVRPSVATEQVTANEQNNDSVD